MAYYFDYFKSLKYTSEQSISLYNIHFRVSSGGGGEGSVRSSVWPPAIFFGVRAKKKERYHFFFFFWGGGGLKEANLSTMIPTKTNKSVESSV